MSVMDFRMAHLILFVAAAVGCTVAQLEPNPASRVDIYDGYVFNVSQVIPGLEGRSGYLVLNHFSERPPFLTSVALDGARIRLKGIFLRDRQATLRLRFHLPSGKRSQLVLAFQGLELDPAVRGCPAVPVAEIHISDGDFWRRDSLVELMEKISTILDFPLDRLKALYNMHSRPKPGPTILLMASESCDADDSADDREQIRNVVNRLMAMHESGQLGQQLIPYTSSQRITDVRVTDQFANEFMPLLDHSAAAAGNEQTIRSDSVSAETDEMDLVGLNPGDHNQQLTSTGASLVLEHNDQFTSDEQENNLQSADLTAPISTPTTQTAPSQTDQEVSRLSTVTTTTTTTTELSSSGWGWWSRKKEDPAIEEQSASATEEPAIEKSVENIKDDSFSMNHNDDSWPITGTPTSATTTSTTTKPSAEEDRNVWLRWLKPTKADDDKKEEETLPAVDEVSSTSRPTTIPEPTTETPSTTTLGPTTSSTTRPSTTSTTTTTTTITTTTPKPTTSSVTPTISLAAAGSSTIVHQPTSSPLDESERADNGDSESGPVVVTTERSQPTGPSVSIGGFVRPPASSDDSSTTHHQEEVGGGVFADVIVPSVLLVAVLALGAGVAYLFIARADKSAIYDLVTRGDLERLNGVLVLDPNETAPMHPLY